MIAHLLGALEFSTTHPRWPMLFRCVRHGVPYFAEVLEAENLSSYSCRRVLPTLAGLVKLSDTERLALGQWTDST